MARTALSTKQFISILQNLALDLPCHTEELRSLDAIIGDGDLGVTINLICKALQDYNRPRNRRYGETPHWSRNAD